MKEMHKFYINGKWVDSIGSETIDVVNPSNESVIGSVSAGTKETSTLQLLLQKKHLIFLAFHQKKKELFY